MKQKDDELRSTNYFDQMIICWRAMNCKQILILFDNCKSFDFAQIYSQNDRKSLFFQLVQTVFCNNNDSSMLLLISINFMHMFWKELNRGKVLFVSSEDFKDSLVKFILRWSKIEKIKVSNFLNSSNDRFPFSSFQSFVNVATCWWNKSGRLHFNLFEHHHFCAC